MSNEQENFNAQLDKNITLEQLFDCSKVSYIKGVLITTNKDLEKAIDWRKDQQISILTKESLKSIIRKNIFKTEEDDEPRVNLRYLAHYILLQIACVDDEYKIHKVLKVRNYKYLVRIYWMPSEAKYRNADYIYKWHSTKKQ